MSHEHYQTVKQIAKRYGNHAATIWRWVKNGQFPQPVKLSPGCTRWRLSDVQAWEASKAVEVRND